MLSLKRERIWKKIIEIGKDRIWKINKSNTDTAHEKNKNKKRAIFVKRESMKKLIEIRKDAIWKIKIKREREREHGKKLKQEKSNFCKKVCC